eukprot:scaffold2360_cov62-Phaeocystis_antarctica.AAC.5
MAIRTSAAPSSSGSRPTTPRPRRASSWRASSSSRATVSAASSENATRQGSAAPQTSNLKKESRG